MHFSSFRNTHKPPSVNLASLNFIIFLFSAIFSADLVILLCLFFPQLPRTQNNQQLLNFSHLASSNFSFLNFLHFFLTNILESFRKFLLFPQISILLLVSDSPLLPATFIGVTGIFTTNIIFFWNN